MEQLGFVIWKSLLVFFLLLLLSRFVGKKLLSRITYFDFVIGITIGTIGGGYIIANVKGSWVLVGPVVFTICTVLTALTSMNSLHLRKIIEGEPVVVIQNGKILENNMKKLRYHLDDLEMQLREQGVFNISEVEFAILEPHGQLSILKKSQNLPLTPKDIHISTQYQGMSSELIKDGDVMEQNLRQNNLSFSWLYQELRKNNINNISEVFLASLGTDGKLFIDKKSDSLKYIQKIED
jgi:uncharacterized membrane protein YcaP (DUF421 family)